MTFQIVLELLTTCQVIQRNTGMTKIIVENTGNPMSMLAHREVDE